MKNFQKLQISIIFTLFLYSFIYAQNSIIDSIALISDYEGHCMVKIDKISQFESARMNMAVFEGAEFKTGPGSYIEITFDDASIVRLSENTTLKLSDLKRKGNEKRTILELAFGKIMAIIDKLKNEDSTFEVHTKMAIAAVKGTELIVTSESDETDELGVFEGEVVYYSKNDKEKAFKKLIKTGKQSRIQKGQNIPEDEFDIRDNLLKHREDMEKIRKEILYIRKLKFEDENKLKEYRLKRKFEKEGEQEIQDKTETKNIKDKNVDDSFGNKFLSSKKLRKTLRKEIINLKRHAARDLKWVSEEMKADLNIGKTMTDVHGNRIRMEEYIFRPQANEIDFLSITFRENRLDYLKTQNFFNAPLPKRINREIFQSDWAFQPKFYKTAEKVTLSNTKDKVTTEVNYKLDPRLDLNAVNDYDAYNFYTDNYLWRLQPVNELIAINGDIKINRELTGNTNNYTMTNRPGFQDPVTVSGPLNPGTDNLAWTSTTTYKKSGADNGWLRIDLYLINDYGKIIKNPDNIGDWASLILDTNVEMRLTSSDFISDYGDIDIVSKMLWWISINPKR